MISTIHETRNCLSLEGRPNQSLDDFGASLDVFEGEIIVFLNDNAKTSHIGSKFEDVQNNRPSIKPKMSFARAERICDQNSNLTIIIVLEDEEEGNKPGGIRI
ncbi:predicted protein [Histoplasma capsulatum H143]|uniref:Uncharacterized protein n=1 Tax=Ajellomyces capsulatus (strain H143) TaxID=544712 RepID=C6H4Y7_AJECH|nr:predicted protein [Histoplasma capsulatum H143]